MGGGQWQVLRLVRGLLARGDAPVLLAREDGELLKRARGEGLPSGAFRWMGWPKADLIHAHDGRAHTAAVLIRRAPLVVARRVAYPIKTGVLSKWKYRRADRYIAVSRFVAGMLGRSGVPAEKIDVVYDGVPLLPLTERRERVIAPANKAVEGYWKSTDLERDLATASVFVYISESEGLGSGLLLAMSAGVPVVASHVGGIPEIVTDGEEGILVDNSRAAIEAAVAKILANPDFYSRNARQKIVERFSEERMVDETLTVYRRLLAHV
jgi:glycosyltransferase involved in cell wall biosynthesis